MPTDLTPAPTDTAPKAQVALGWTRTVTGFTTVEVDANDLLAWLQTFDPSWTLGTLQEITPEDLTDYLREKNLVGEEQAPGPGALTEIKALAIALGLPEEQA